MHSLKMDIQVLLLTFLQWTEAVVSHIPHKTSSKGDLQMQYLKTYM